MTIKTHRPITLGVSDVAREVEVQHEIESYLRALASYPDRFAHDPYLSFEQYLSSVMATGFWWGDSDDHRRAS